MHLRLLCALTLAVIVAHAASASSESIDLPLDNGQVIKIFASPGAADTAGWPILRITGTVRIEGYGDCAIIQPQMGKPLAINLRSREEWRSAITGLLFFTAFSEWKAVRDCGAPAPSGPDYIFLWGAGQPRYLQLPVNVHFAQSYVDALIESKVNAGIEIVNAIVGTEVLAFNATRLETTDKLEGRRPLLLIRYIPGAHNVGGFESNDRGVILSTIAGLKAAGKPFKGDVTPKNPLRAHARHLIKASPERGQRIHCAMGVFSNHSVVGNAQIKMSLALDNEESYCVLAGLLYTVGVDISGLAIDARMLETEMSRGSAVLPNNAIRIFEPTVVTQIRQAFQ